MKKKRERWRRIITTDGYDEKQDTILIHLVEHICPPFSSNRAPYFIDAKLCYSIFPRNQYITVCSSCGQYVFLLWIYEFLGVIGKTTENWLTLFVGKNWREQHNGKRADLSETRSWLAGQFILDDRPIFVTF